LERPLQQAQPIHQSFVDVELAESTTTGSVSEKKLHLLVVEDNSDLREFLKNSFDELYKVSTANDGKEAWEIIQKKVPDLIVSDIMMPNMNGFDLCKLIKSTFETSHIPVILLTSLDERSKQLEGLCLGADDYITKPFDVSILKQRIISIIKNRDIVRDKVLKLFNQTDQEVPILSNEQNDQFVKKALKVVRENIANSEFGKDKFYNLDGALGGYVKPGNAVVSLLDTGVALLEYNTSATDGNAGCIEKFNAAPLPGTVGNDFWYHAFILGNKTGSMYCLTSCLLLSP
jgi:CheY-like chemotaxis protein